MYLTVLFGLVEHAHDFFVDLLAQRLLFAAQVVQLLLALLQGEAKRNKVGWPIHILPMFSTPEEIHFVR